jgi:O-methyltransferase
VRPAATRRSPGEIGRALLRRAGYRLEPVARPGRLERSHPDLDPAFVALHARCAPFTMTSVERMYALWQAVRHVRRRGIPGDLVECGVWRGGSSMLAALTLDQEDDRERRLWLYDTFAGMSEPSSRDVAVDGFSAREHWDEIRADPGGLTFASAGRAEVESNLTSTGIAPERLEYVEGPVEQTIPGTVPARIAVLRLDTDWYESTRHELEHLWELVEPGGVLIVDDYGFWAGAREAVEEFFAARADAPLLGRVDHTGRMGVKPG